MSSILFPKLEQESSFPLKSGTSFLKIAEFTLTFVHLCPLHALSHFQWDIEENC